MHGFILKGNICHSKSINSLEITEQGYVICVNGLSAGVFISIPPEYAGLPVYDHGDRIIIPGLCDLHTHAPQYTFRGMGMDLELMQWLQKYTFPEEKKYADIEYAEKTYKIFADRLRKGAVTRACIFGTVHTPTVNILMKLLEESGIVSFVGKVSMDREAPPELCESADAAAVELPVWIESSLNFFKNTRPVITPRFIPCCSDRLMKKLKEIRKRYNLPVQSHLSENPSEINLVKKLRPDSSFYGDAYNRSGLFGRDAQNGEYFRTVMAHCVHSSDAELELMAENGVFAAHCPASNANLASGIAPVRKMLEMGVKVGLGSDVAGGHSDSVFRAMTDAIQMSKLYYRLVDSTKKPLTFAESFYMATRGGGEFFGNAGSFENGFEFDAVILDDSKTDPPYGISTAERIERFAYLSGDIDGICEKYVRGRKIL